MWASSRVHPLAARSSWSMITPELEDAAPPFDGDGDIRFRFEEVSANGSNDDGVQLEEFGPGDLRGTIEESEAEVTGNGDDGLDLTQAAPGEGLVKIDEDTDVSGNADDDVNPDGVTVVTEG